MSTNYFQFEKLSQTTNDPSIEPKIEQKPILSSLKEKQLTYTSSLVTNDVKQEEIQIIKPKNDIKSTVEPKKSLDREKIEEKQFRVCVRNTLPVYKYPTKESEIIDKLYNGSIVSSNDRKNNWLKIKLDKKTGWILASRTVEV